MDRATTCCFTGHRPDKLPWGSRESDPRCLTLKRRLTQAVEGAYALSLIHILSVGWTGCFDSWTL